MSSSLDCKASQEIQSAEDGDRALRTLKSRNDGQDKTQQYGKVRQTSAFGQTMKSCTEERLANGIYEKE